MPGQLWRALRRGGTALTAALALAACDGEPAGPDATAPYGRIEGTVVAPGVQTFRGLTATVLWSGSASRAPVEPGGAFSVELASEPTGIGFLTLEADAASGLHPALVVLSEADLGEEHTVVLAPTSWTLASGAYAGRTVPIDPALAADPSVLPSYWGFFFPFVQDGFRQTVLDPSDWVGEMRSWPESAYPVAVAFDRPGSDGALTAADSIAFWSHVERMEAALGWDAFRPARLEEVEVLGGPRRAPGAILVQVDRDLGLPGVGLTGPAERGGWELRADAGPWAGGEVDFLSFSSGDIGYAHVVVNDPAVLSEGRLVIHELMHTLGVGHGCAWRSVQTYCPSLASDVPTAEDVAHLQVLRRMRDLERRHDTRWGVIASVLGRRALALDLTPVPSPAGLQERVGEAGPVR